MNRNPGKMQANALATAAFAVAPLGAMHSLGNQAYAALKQALSDTDIYAQREEIRLDERSLSLQLGVSRTPIREAMNLLENEGFLRTRPRRGVFIVRKTKKEVVEMIQVWAALEGMAARLITQRASDADIAGLRRMFDDFADQNPAEHMDEYSDANIEFHQAIMRLCGSQLIAGLTENLFIHVRAIRKATIRKGDRAERSIVDHLNIVEALERRDTEAAERLAREHTLGLAEFVERHCDFLD
jgi:DNA-binding GntR family transcriptional regulator